MVNVTFDNILDNHFKYFKKPTPFTKSNYNNINALFKEILEEDSYLNHLCNKYNIKNLNINSIKNSYFSNSMDYPSLNIYINNESRCLGSVSLYVVPNCCGLCSLVNLAACGDTNINFHIVMTIALHIARIIGYAKAYYTDVIYKSEKDPLSQRVTEYFKYDTEEKSVKNSLWTIIDEAVSHRTFFNIATFSHNMTCDIKKHNEILEKNLNSIIK